MTTVNIKIKLTASEDTLNKIHAEASDYGVKLPHPLPENVDKEVSLDDVWNNPDLAMIKGMVLANIGSFLPSLTSDDKSEG